MLQFHPKKGTVLYCDFQGYKVPEMVKERPVIVVSPKLQGRSMLCTVVPISSKQPKPHQPYHHKMDPASLTPKLRKTACWAKCDMLYTVSLERLDRVYEGRASNGKRKYATGQATTSDIQCIEVAITHGLGLQRLLLLRNPEGKAFGV